MNQLRALASCEILRTKPETEITQNSLSNCWKHYGYRSAKEKEEEH